MKKKSKVVMDRKELIEEHEHLVKVLKGSKTKEAKEEAKEQAQELRTYKRRNSKVK
jgi:hypothetical protein